LLAWLWALSIFLGCACSNGTEGPSRTLTLGAFSTPREVYRRAVIPAFQRHWYAQTGETVRVRESYQGSGALARAVLGGFEADVVALSLETDMEKLVRAGLITHDWRARPHGGMVTRSVVALAVRRGNPHGIRSWHDLRRAGLDVLTPDVRTSGGAMWNVAALYGSALREGAASDAQSFLTAVLRNVSVMDRGTREMMITFERGIGDVAITYENEVLVGRQNGQSYEAVIPPSTLLIENPIAVVDANATRHGTLDLARAFVAFVVSPEAQRAFAAHGFRPVDETVAHAVSDRYPTPARLFTVRDLGGWSTLQQVLFAPGATYDRALAVARRGHR
jgi:sulfate transport system substrate-binding protein